MGHFSPGAIIFLLALFLIWAALIAFGWWFTNVHAPRKQEAKRLELNATLDALRPNDYPE